VLKLHVRGFPSNCVKICPERFVFWDAKSGGLVKLLKILGKTAVFNTVSHTLKINAADFSKTSLIFYKTTLLRVPEDTN